MQDGDIVLVKARRWLRWLCTYDHAGIVWSYDGAWHCCEAGFSGVRSWPMGHWGRGYIIIRPIVAASHGSPWPCELGILVAADALAMQGEHYDLLHLVRAIWRIVKRKFRRPGIAAQAGVVCSELACNVWRGRGVDLCPGVAVPTPDDLADAVMGRRAVLITTREEV